MWRRNEVRSVEVRPSEATVLEIGPSHFRGNTIHSPVFGSLLAGVAFVREPDYVELQVGVPDRSVFLICSLSAAGASAATRGRFGRGRRVRQATLIPIVTAELTLQGSVAVAGGGVSIILSGVARIRDWLHIGTLLASYDAVLKSPFGPKYFNRAWKRRESTRKVFGWFAVFIGMCWLVGGVASALS